MLSPISKSSVSRTKSRHRRLWHDETLPTSSLGCLGCKELGLCGGLRVEADFNDCMQFCCGTPDRCDRVCRRNPDYPNRVREVGTFALNNVPRSFVLAAPKIPLCVPIVYHRTRRDSAFKRDTIALPFHEMFDAIGKPRFANREELCRTFAVASESSLLLSGTTLDSPLEKWWGFGEDTRRSIIRSLKDLGISLVTTPNYSLFIDRPRWDDLHAIKRIGLVHSEFLSEGLPAALHTNGRTETDFRRWAEYIADRPEVTHIAYEFVTGTACAGRRMQHATWLARLAESVERPLHLIVRGGSDLLPALKHSFPSITYLDTSVFMKTMMRRRAAMKTDGKVAWEAYPTPQGSSLDSLLLLNDQVVTESIARSLPQKK